MSFIEQMQNTFRMESAEVARLGEYVDMDAAERLADKMLEVKQQGSRLFFAGVGTSGAAAKKGAHSFSCIEFPAMFLSPGDAVHGGLGAVCPGDMVLLISKGGGTTELVNMLPGLRYKKAILVAITENPDSALGKAADYVVQIRIEREPDPFNMLATASTLSVIAFIDSMAIYLMQKSGFSKEQFAVIHPSGAVGDRLINDLP